MQKKKNLTKIKLKIKEQDKELEKKSWEEKLQLT